MTTLMGVQKPNVLMVDDRQENLVALKAILKDLDANLVMASSGNEALSHIIREEFALILLDVQMPEMDGFETASLIREHDTSQHTPIVFLTAISKEECYVMQGYHAGAIDYLTKPLNPNILRAKVDVLLDLYCQKQLLKRTLHELEDSQVQLQHQSEALLRSNEDLTTYASVASHELQEPLRKIHMFGDRLKHHCAEQLDAKGQRYLGSIQQSSLRMQALIKDILKLSKVQKQAGDFEEVDVSSIVSEVVEEFRSRLEEIDAKIDVGAFPVISADPNQLRQVFRNLVGNAFKYRQKNRQLCLSMVGTRESDGPSAYCQIVVQDNGIGFSSEYQERIFEMFKRLHGNKEYDGTGIGLSLCRKIVERHGGTITATGRPDQGATFVIRLPLHHHQTLPLASAS